MVRVSVVVCTYNRASLLRECLEHLLRQTAAPETWELLIVDNNSTDDTRSVVESFSAAPVPIRYCLETNQGVSHARNRGFGEARMDFVAYTDDDILVEADWLEWLQRCLTETGADAVGGRIRLLYEGDPPDWWGAFFRRMLGEVDLGDARVELRPGQMLNSGNMAYRTQLLRSSDGFAAALGRSGTRLAGLEDSVLLSNVLVSGARVVYEPGAVVSHRIASDRLNWPYFERMLESQGSSLALLDPAALLALRLQESLSESVATRIGRTRAGRYLEGKTGYTALPLRPRSGLRLRVALTDWVLLTASAALALRWRLKPGVYARQVARCKYIMTRSMQRSRWKQQT